MKPSEWIEQNKLIKGKQPSSIWSDLKKLDKRFIDKEELKRKINIIFNENEIHITTTKLAFVVNIFKKEILELLEE